MVRNYPAVVLQYSFIHFESRFSSGEDVGGNTTRTNRNTSRFSATSDGSAGSTPRRDQANTKKGPSKHQEGTKQTPRRDQANTKKGPSKGWRCDQVTWSLDDFLVAFPCV